MISGNDPRYQIKIRDQIPYPVLVYVPMAPSHVSEKKEVGIKPGLFVETRKNSKMRELESGRQRGRKTRKNELVSDLIHSPQGGIDFYETVSSSFFFFFFFSSSRLWVGCSGGNEDEIQCVSSRLNEGVRL